jgi:hypothetical protein
VKAKTGEPRSTETGLIALPAYPWASHELFANLRAMLVKEERSDSMTFDRLAQIAGKPKSTVHHWLEISPPSAVIAFLCWLERLPPAQRHLFVDSHCRPLPRLEHMINSRCTIRKLRELVHLGRGLTIISGGTESTRAALAAALCYDYRRASAKHQSVAGIDLHRPTDFVPAESLLYIDGAIGPDHVQRLVLRVWPKLLTSPATVLILHGIWSAVSEVRDAILRCTRKRHVVLAEAGPLDPTELKDKISSPLHVLTLSDTKRGPGAIRIRWRRIRPRKDAGN